MAAIPSLPSLLNSLNDSLSSALGATPKLSGLEPTKDGLSLLDVKNELLLSYLQNLIFLILLKIRHANSARAGEGKQDTGLSDLTVRKLVELRVFLEKGVRPLEDKLRYQIEKVLRAADDAERNSKVTEASGSINGTKYPEKASPSAESSGSDDESNDGDHNGVRHVGKAQVPKTSDLQYRPNLSAFVRPEADPSSKSKSSSGVYRPPKVAPTVMPTTERREKADRKPLKSTTLDEFIATELSAAPVSEPSIGTTIAAGGRKIKTASERKEEAERLDYEEKNFVRLPKESKKERARKGNLAGRSGRMDFGGEEWRDLGDGVDRINRLTKSKSASSGTRKLLEKSRKRALETADGPRGSGNSQGVEMGERFQKRLKVLDGGRRDRGKKRS